MNGRDLDAIVELAEPGATQLARSGGKGANLARLLQAGLPVPAGYVVGTAAYRRFVDDAGLDALVSRVTDDLNGADPTAVEAASTTLRSAFEAAPIPEFLGDAIAAAYAALGDGPVAVRSSATAEDLPEATFAGQQETVLGVRGAPEVVAAVRRCWSSLWTARAGVSRSKRHPARAGGRRRRRAADGARRRRRRAVHRRSGDRAARPRGGRGCAGPRGRARKWARHAAAVDRGRPHPGDPRGSRRRRHRRSRPGMAGRARRTRTAGGGAVRRTAGSGVGRRAGALLAAAVAADHLAVPAAALRATARRRSAGVHAAQPGRPGHDRAVHPGRHRVLPGDGTRDAPAPDRAPPGADPPAPDVGGCRPDLLRRHAAAVLAPARGPAGKAAAAEGPDGRRRAARVARPQRRSVAAATPRRRAGRNRGVAGRAVASHHRGGSRPRTGPAPDAGPGGGRAGPPPARGSRSGSPPGAGRVPLRSTPGAYLRPRHGSTPTPLRRVAGDSARRTTDGALAGFLGRRGARYADGCRTTRPSRWA